MKPFYLTLKASPDYGLALFMWSLDCSKIAHFQHNFCKKSSKINDSHMVHIRKRLFCKVLRTYEYEKWLVFVIFSPVQP